MPAGCVHATTAVPSGPTSSVNRSTAVPKVCGAANWVAPSDMKAVLTTPPSSQAIVAFPVSSTPTCGAPAPAGAVTGANPGVPGTCRAASSVPPRIHAASAVPFAPTATSAPDEPLPPSEIDGSQPAAPAGAGPASTTATAMT